MILYADTSALAKALREEEGTHEVLVAIRDAERVASAAIAYVELRAALAAVIRAARLPVNQRDDLTRELEDLWDRIAEIPLDRPLLRQAGDLAERFRLRGYDAVHLAALRTFGGPGDIVFACWDNDLRRAARGLGYTLLPA